MKFYHHSDGYKKRLIFSLLVECGWTTAPCQAENFSAKNAVGSEIVPMTFFSGFLCKNLAANVKRMRRYLDSNYVSENPSQWRSRKTLLSHGVRVLMTIRKN